MTDEPAPIREQNRILTELDRLVAERNAAIEAAEVRLKAAQLASETELEEANQRIEVESQAATRTAQRDFQNQKQQLQKTFEREYRPAEQEYHALRDKISNTYNVHKAAAKKVFQEARWETTTVFDATKHKPRREFLLQERDVNTRAQRLEQIANEAKQYLFDCRLYRDPAVDMAGVAEAEGDDPRQRFLDRLTAADELLLELKKLKLPRFFGNGGPIWSFLAIAAALIVPAGFLSGWDVVWLISAGGMTIVLGGGLTIWLYVRARTVVSRVFDPLCQALLDSELARQHWHEQATAKWQRETAEIKQRYDADLERAAAKYNDAKATAKERRENESRGVEDKYPPRLASLKRNFEESSRAFTKQQQAAAVDLKASHAAALKAAQDRFKERTTEGQAQYERDWQALTEAWRQGLRDLHASAARLRALIEQRFPDWNAPDWETWTPATEVSPVVSFGRFETSLEQFSGAISDDPRLKVDVPASFQLPAMLSFPDRGSLVLKAAGAGRAKAVDLLQATMLRYLSAIPPGKVRFTIIDPVGLGQNFAGFMHLADYDELLVTHKIWTEPPHIEQRLSDLSSHMSNVIQKYLRNQFETIEDYNANAGEVAEPYRVLVVANFPFNFTEAATRYLLSVAGTGAHCGVYTLVSVDTKLALPHGFRMPDLEQYGIKLVWKEQGWVWKEEQFEKFPLQVDSAPSPDRFSRIVHLAGEGAKHASRVEVPFDFIAPPEDKYWTWSSSTGVDVPLGRAGATKRQNMKLGRGTAQHVLIAGKTGSGKSTLLHALITNLALMYSPDEVEMYLIDFKKGVEFKTYAQFELPHARVVAIESEREFGLSVLQRLDAELKYRGDMFRDLNVPDLNSYRQANPGARLPRIMLIVDEFQEFFVEDDKIAQDVSLLLDRLVRQGRAFGIHVNLGSQTLGGAYGLARTTLGQMAVRIALQCSEADANLILSEENAAARLLSRPGEAIYNDANGRTEGNNLFQVVWLADTRHEEYLRQVQDMAAKTGKRVPEQIIFEGNIPADISKNHMLTELITAPAWTPAPPLIRAWLGDAIAIKEPTAAEFRRQSGGNIAMIGQQSEGALAMMVSMLVSLAVQHPPAAENGGGPKFYIFDGSPPDALHVGTLGRLTKISPHPVEAVSLRDLPRVIGELAAEVERRRTSTETDTPPIYVLIYDLPRFRDLRKAEDDFSFSREAKANPAKQFANILREGPPMGVHTIIWCDTLTNLFRTFERQAMREFETRILFQMSVADSSSLIDSPSASKLGPHRALLHSEEKGLLEKFRPYSLPDESWLRWFADECRRRTELAAGTSPS